MSVCVCEGVAQSIGGSCRQTRGKQCVEMKQGFLTLSSPRGVHRRVFFHDLAISHLLILLTKQPFCK